MFSSPQLVPAPLNPTPIIEYFKRSHPQCERSQWQGIIVGKQSKGNVMR